MTATAQKYLTLEEYFEFEYQSNIRHEFINGKLYPMSYTSPNHGRIVHNLSRVIGNCLFDTNSEIWTENRMLFVPDCHRVYYPDALIVSDQPKYYNYKGKMDATLNPGVLIEIGSDSTEENDKTDKWHCYQTIESLQQYVLVSQKMLFVEMYERQENEPGKWTYTSADQLENVVNIGGCEIKIKDIYHKVEFPKEEVL